MAHVMVMVLYVRCMYAVCRRLYVGYSLHNPPRCGMAGCSRRYHVDSVCIAHEILIVAIVYGFYKGTLWAVIRCK